MSAVTETEARLEYFTAYHKIGTNRTNIEVPTDLGLPGWLAHPRIIDPSLRKPLSSESCSELGGISERMQSNLAKFGVKDLFAVQAAVIPELMDTSFASAPSASRGIRDLCVSSATGSGKTIAYAVPVIERLAARRIVRLRALVVVPTRDLVLQVRETFEALSKGTNLKIGIATGQSSFASEQQSLQGGQSRVDILICTPGRLIDHLEGTPGFTLQHLEFLVVDEADRLLSQQFQGWLGKVLDDIDGASLSPPSSLASSSQFAPIHLNSIGVSLGHDAVTWRHDSKPSVRVQKLLFSATLTRDPAKIASLRLVDPLYIAVQRPRVPAAGVSSSDAMDIDDAEVTTLENLDAESFTTPDTLTEYMTVCDQSDKPLALLHLLYSRQLTSVLCFTASVDSAHRLFQLVTLFNDRMQEQSGGGSSSSSNGEHSLVAAEISSDLTKDQRAEILRRFRRGEIHLIIGTDVVGRGVHLDDVQAVVNYDTPMSLAQYTHRVGRTARAGKDGDAFTLLETKQAKAFKEMMTKAGHLARVKRLDVKTKHLSKYQDCYNAALEQLKGIYTS
ncbi:DEAD-domain-containing protein [Ramicandelaber brevisporus]|nr:DEAD-domain-containing protein [Ramicandelaber brevisporus]